jgi:hypothetical protein
VASAEAGNIVRELGQAPIPTIGDTAGLGKRGALINMFMEGAYIGFAINAPASKANGLSVSVKLLVLARPGRMATEPPPASPARERTTSLQCNPCHT